MGALLSRLHGAVAVFRATWLANHSRRSPSTVRAYARPIALATGTLVAASIITLACTSGSATGPDDPSSVGSVSVQPPSAALGLLDTVRLTATATSASGQPMSVSIEWSSAHPAIASVSAGGLVTALTTGTDTVTASAGGQTASTVIVVTPAAPTIAAVTVAPAHDTIGLPGTTQLAATAVDASGHQIPGTTFTWSSSHPSVATVSGTGLVTAVALGTDTVLATAGGHTGSAIISVTSGAPVIASITVAPASASIAAGTSIALTDTAKDASGHPITGVAVTWASRKTTVATISAAGVVTGVAVGTDTVTATASGHTGVAVITVTAPAVASIVVDPASAFIAPSATVQLVDTAKDGSGRPISGVTVTWASKHTTVATVSATGLVSGVAAGTDTVTATASGHVGSAVITVGTANVTFNINTSATHGISRFIYGMNFMTETAPWGGTNTPSGVTLSRLGGNRLTAYNWTDSYSNVGNDGDFDNDNYLDPSTAPGDAVAFRTNAAFGRGAGQIVTVPMIGYVAGDNSQIALDTLPSDRAARLAAHFKVSVPTKGSTFTLTPDTTLPSVYQDEFVNWVNTKYPGSVSDPVKPIFFELDNEPDIWNSTHAEITETIHTYDGFIDTTIMYAKAIKAVAPSAKVFGPVVATYTGLVTLGEYPTPDPNYPDWQTQPFMNVYLSQMQQASTTAGMRLLDVFDFHWYPAAGNTSYTITNDYAPQTPDLVTARLQAPRSLWDPSYNEGSWVSQTVGGPIELLPRVQNSINTNYPGTNIAITEYYYGRAGDISGGLAQADVLGIFGKYGVYAATMWPNAGLYASPYGGSGALAYAYAFGAFDLFTNYDGAGSGFGSVGIAAATTDSVNTSVYASIDGSNHVVIVAINKTSSPSLAVMHVTSATTFHTAHVYLMANGTPVPAKQADLTVTTGNTVAYSMPAMSATTLVLTP